MQYLENVKGKELLPGLYGRFVHGQSITMSFVDIKKGTRMPEHSHPHEQITHILEGELEMTIGGNTMLLTTGAVHVIPGHVKHNAVAHTDCKVIDVFSPVREDYVIG